jgi:hypothetical protein
MRDHPMDFMSSRPRTPEPEFNFIPLRYRSFPREPVPRIPHPYGRPNGGHRILPSQYTGLRHNWVRSEGLQVMPSRMNNGHLENTLKLLKESHLNLIGRSNEFLGKLCKHLQNQPELCEKIEQLAKSIELLDVDDVYPVWDALSAELEGRQSSAHWGPTINDWLDDDNYPF